MGERRSPKPLVAGSSPVIRANKKALWKFIFHGAFYDLLANLRINADVGEKKNKYIFSGCGVGKRGTKIEDHRMINSYPACKIKSIMNI